MPDARTKSGWISWREEGPHENGVADEPVLMIMGLGASSRLWFRLLPWVARQHRAIVFDNRGTGGSAPVRALLSMRGLAEDAVTVLDAAGVERAHVYGISLGGMIAQEVALRHPDRVEALVLGATTPGGAEHVPPADHVVEFLRLRAQMTAEHAVWASVPINYAPRTRLEGGDRIARDIEQRLRYPIEPEYYSAQLDAANAHDARVHDIRAPTLVVHGGEDVLILPANGRRLVELIPDAKLSLWPAAAHLYFTDEPEIDRHIAGWLSGRSSPSRA
jgi:3-oxoadipate enol-lactonase